MTWMILSSTSCSTLKQWIKNRAEERAMPPAPGPEYVYSAPEHQTFATENVLGNFKWKDQHSKFVSGPTC